MLVKYSNLSIDTDVDPHTTESYWILHKPDISVPMILVIRLLPRSTDSITGYGNNAMMTELLSTHLGLLIDLHEAKEVRFDFELDT
jgi:hypothetical protein